MHDPAPATPPAPAEGVPADERQVAMLCHLLVFVGFAVPLGGIVAPLILWITKKNQMPFVDEQGREVLNFQISVVLWFLVVIVACVALGFGLAALTPEAALFAFLPFGLAAAALSIGWFVFSILGAVRASAGEHFRFPLTLRLIPARRDPRPAPTP